MKGIEQKNGCIHYYGNPAGYIDQGTAVLDNLFQCDELNSWLSKRNLPVRWTDGVYDRLSNGTPAHAGEIIVPLKSCRIWQLKPDVDIMMKFISFVETVQKFGEPAPANYYNVYEGQIETNSLEEIWAKFSQHHSPGYNGHLLSISDVVELYDNTGSEFYYVDRYGFQKIDFIEHAHQESPSMTMLM